MINGWFEGFHSHGATPKCPKWSMLLRKVGWSEALNATPLETASWRQRQWLSIAVSRVNKTGWWFSHPSEKYESQLGWLFPIYGKIKNGNQTTNQKNIGTLLKKSWTSAFQQQCLTLTEHVSQKQSNSRVCWSSSSTFQSSIICMSPGSIVNRRNVRNVQPQIVLIMFIHIGPQFLHSIKLRNLQKKQ